MRIIRHTLTLFYHDGVQVFEARDAIGGNYLCLLCEAGDELDKYLVVGVSPEALQTFKSGDIDLRQIICQRELGKWFIASCTPDLEKSVSLLSQDGEIPENFLPSEGFFLNPQISLVQTHT